MPICIAVAYTKGLEGCSARGSRDVPVYNLLHGLALGHWLASQQFAKPNKRQDFGSFRFATVFVTIFLTTALPIFVNATGNVVGLLAFLTLLAGFSLIYIYYVVVRTF